MPVVVLPKPPEDPKKSKGSLLVPAAPPPLLLLVKVSAEELVFIFEEVEVLVIIKLEDVSCDVDDEAKSNRVSRLEEDAEETAVLDGLIKSLEKKLIKKIK